MNKLGRLTRIDLRDIWKTEAQDFTPWLAQEANLFLLSETLSIELELEAMERNVGPFRADILCRDILTEEWVLIENQLERTDHSHLGQLITYAAGLDAVTIVWIAARIADEHRAAIDWLNETTEAGIRFFALEVELWKIGDSPAAPKFNVVCKPNDWSRNAASARKAISEGELSPTRELQREYWETVETLVANNGGPINPVKPQPQSWMSHSIGRTGFGLNMSLNTRENWIRVEIYISGSHAKDFFSLLECQKDSIESELGFKLEWQRLDEKRDVRICVSLNNADPTDHSDWNRQHSWLVEKLFTMHDVFRPRVKILDPDLGEAL